MPRPEFGKELPDGPALSATRFFESLADALHGVGTGRYIKQSLVGLSVLYDGGGLPLDRQYYGTLAFMQLLHEVAGAASEGGERLDVFGDV
jgi:hypothetical protein